MIVLGSVEHYNDTNIIFGMEWQKRHTLLHVSKCLVSNDTNVILHFNVSKCLVSNDTNVSLHFKSRVRLLIQYECGPKYTCNTGNVKNVNGFGDKGLCKVKKNKIPK